MGLQVRPVALGDDDRGADPAALARVLRGGVEACLLTPRAQNPTGAAWDARRARVVRDLLDAHPGVLLIEDDHAGPVAGVPAFTACHAGKERWAVVRSVSKSLGPDLRLAVLAGDALTVARVQGRQALGTGWVSHLLQECVLALWSDAAVRRRLKDAADRYTQRRAALVKALADRGIEARGRSGLNVWIPVAEEAPVVGALAEAGWLVNAGERYRLESPPAIRITVASLLPPDAERLARDLARILRPGPPVSAA
jgi:DNA-binding transcriptional MocR family regulator